MRHANWSVGLAELHAFGRTESAGQKFIDSKVLRKLLYRLKGEE